MANQPEEAASLFNQGYNCCQSILATFAPRASLPSETALKLAGPFGGGMGRMGEVCGAVTGALMVIGLHAGFSRPADEEAKRSTYAIVRQFTDRFKARNASMCRELIGHRIDTPEALQEAREKGLLARCPVFVRDAAELLLEIGV